MKTNARPTIAVSILLLLFSLMGMAKAALPATFVDQSDTYTVAAGSRPFESIFGTTDSVRVSLAGDDVVSGPVALPFPFFFKPGQASNSIRISTNGIVTFGTNAAFSNVALPASGMDNTALAFWDDLWVVSNTAQGVEVKTLGVAPFRVFVVEFHGLFHYAYDTSLLATFQIRIFEGTGAIECDYGDVNFDDGTGQYDGGVSATVGVQIDSTDYLQYSLNERVLTDNSFIRFDRAAGAVQVLSLVPPVSFTSPTQKTVSFQFSGNVNVDASKVRLLYGGEQDITSQAVFSYNPVSYIGTLTFPDNLKAGQYSITILESVTDTVNGLALDGDFDGVPGGNYVVPFSINTPPSMTAIGNVNTDELVLWQSAVQAQDIDVPAQTLVYDLTVAPAGMQINATTGMISWTPSEAQGPGTFNVTARVRDNGIGGLSDSKSFTVTVAEVNVPPILDPIADKALPPGGSVAFTALAHDADLPAQALAFSLGAGAPADAIINPTTGQFTWTPQGALTQAIYPINIIVTDNGTPALSATTLVRIAVNSPPIMQPISNATINELVAFQLAVQAQDSDVPAQTLTYDLVTAPAGMQINATTGIISWTPSEAQGPGTFNVTARVRDNGLGTLSTTQSFTIAVNEVNSAPTIDAVAEQQIVQGGTVTFQAVAHDGDLPAQQMVFSLGAGAPAGATINPATGQFSWTLNGPPTQPSYDVTIVATDNGTPNLSGSRIVRISSERRITVSLAQSSVIEGGSVNGTVSVNVAQAADFPVTLGVSQANRLSFPATVLIPAGQTSAPFTVQSVQNTAIENPVTVSLIATAAGVTAATTQLQILDDDTPTILFTLDNSAVLENGGPQAVRGTITLDRASANALAVTFTTSVAGQITLPASLTIPAGSLTIPVPITIMDNSVVDGNRVVQITARLVNSGQVITTAPPVDLTINDDEGPSLSLTFDRTLLIEGTNPAATGTVSVNPATTIPLIVTLTSSNTAKLTAPTTVTILAGQTSAAFSLATGTDGVPTGTQRVSLNAATAGYNPVVASLSITDLQKPDLTLEFSATPTGAETDSFVDLHVILRNQGAVDAQGPFTQRISLSTDSVVGNDVLLTQFGFSGRLLAGTWIEQTLRVRLPAQAGRYWFVAETDTGAAIDEVLEDNNAAVSLTSIDIEPAYTTTLSIAPTSVPSATPIPITGTATLRSGGPAPFSLVNIHITNRGIEQIIAALTDSSGQFSTSFTPGSGKGGLFLFGASHPGTATAPVQDQVTVFGLGATPSTVTVEMLETSGENGGITIANLSEVPVSGLSVAVSGVPAGVQATATLSATSMDAAGTATLNYSISSTTPLANATFTLAVTSTQGAAINIPVNLKVIARTAVITAEPARLSAAMVPGQQTTLSFLIKNGGSIRTSNLRVLIPAVAPWITAAGGQNIAPIEPGASATVSLVLLPPANLPLTQYFGNLAVVDEAGQGTSIPYTFRALSEARGGFSVDVVDEFFFFSPDAPKVVGATVTLSDVITGATVAEGQTDANGRASFPDLRQDYYRVEVSATGHAINRGTYFVEGGVNPAVQIFITRNLVTYSWQVEQEQITDHYTVHIESTFETNVPAPVVTVSPPTFDVSDLKTVGQTKQILMTVENHGLIAAQAAKFFFGNHPYYKFEPAVDDLGTLPAKSTVVVPIKITRIAVPTPPAPPLAASGAQYFAAAAPPAPPAPCSISAGLEWDYICGIIPVARISIIAVNGVDGDCGSPPSPPSGPGGGGGGLSAGGGFTFPSISIPAPSLCDCKKLFGGDKACLSLEEAFKFPNFLSGLTSRITAIAPAHIKSVDVQFGVNGKACVHCCDGGGVGLKAEGSGFARIKITATFGKDITPEFEVPPGSDWVQVSVAVTEGFLGIEAEIEGSVELNGEGDTCDGELNFCAAGKVQLTLKAGVGIEAEVSAKGGTGGEEFEYSGKIKGTLALEGSAQAWVKGCKKDGFRFGACAGLKAVASLSGELSAMDLGGVKRTRTITLGGEHEIAKGGTCIDDPAPPEGAPLFLLGTAAAEPPPDYTVFVPSSELTKSDDEIKTALIPSGHSGVCATVKLSLDQDVVMTRSVFAASLDVKNNAETALNAVSLDIAVLDAVGVRANDRFAIQQVNGSPLNGSLTVAPHSDISGRWRIVPLDVAAPTGPTAYTVGGTLRYTQDGVEVVVPLAPVTITVQPDAALFVKYFHQRDVFSDDPFTDQIEPAIPYSLAVMVLNNGAGTAHNLQITSGQPKIVDNEKGLLVDFRIIATQVAGQPLLPSLTADFGEVAPGQIKIGEWLFTSTLQGLFTDYSATFQHIDDLGDPRTSLIKEVEIHEMIHRVRALGALDDGAPDFLVNDVPDNRHLPDTLYFSDGTIAPVVVVESASVSGVLSPAQLSVTLTAPMPAGLAYLRVPEPANGQYELMRVVRSDGLELPLDTDAWVTDRTFIGLGQRPVYENILHLFDNNSTGSYTLTYQSRLAPDTLAPTSHVKTLAAQSAMEFPVDWEGTDDRRVAFYDIYVSTDSSPYVLWLQRSQDSGAIFQGEMGRTYSFYSRATDAAGNVEAAPTTADATTHVSLSNLAPTLALIPDQQVTEGETLVIDTTASDPDGRADLLTFAITSEVPGLTIDSHTGRIRWVTSEADGGRQVQVQVTVTDSGTPSQTATRWFAITVLEDNQAPVLTPIAPQWTAVGQTLLVQAQAQDQDFPAQTIRYSLTGIPPHGMVINATTGLITWQSEAADADQTFLVTLAATDSGTPAKSATLSFSITVGSAVVDHAPQFYTAGGEIWFAGTVHTLQISAFDPDGDAVRLALQATGLPGQLSFASTDGTGLGVITWDTTGVPPGIYPLPLQASAGVARSTYAPLVKIVADNSYWRWAVPKLGGLADLSMSDPTADADGDGMPNLNEWALLSNPLVRDSVPLAFTLSGPFDGWYAADFSLYRRRGSNQFVTLAPQFSSDLGADSWQDVTPPDFEVILDPFGDSDANPETEEVAFRVWLSPGDPVAKRFFRVKSSARPVLP